ncbi:MAG: alkaline phosphatase D family protein, partial [Cyanobacteria bacterium J06636_27]
KQQPNELNSSNPASVFGLSVASGDPSDTGVILWTRINPEKYNKNKPLTYEVCESNRFDNNVITNQVEASTFGEQTDYTVHVDLDGTLEPGKTYFYRFKYDGVYSKTGRCKTLSSPDAIIDKLRLAVITCNDYSTGYFNAFYHLAKEDVDFVVHLGDFAYEYSQYPPHYGEIYRKDIHWEGDNYNQSSSQTQRATSLENFQQIYRTYRQDLGLQAAMEKHTWMITLDDHEVADNWYWDDTDKTIMFEPGHPILKDVSEEKRASQENKKQRANLYNNAIKAWQQYIPARLKKAENSENPEQNNSEEIPEILEGLKLRENLIYRQFRFGTLVDFFLTDSRSFRSKPDIDPDKPNPQATMLGENQKQWLIDGVKNSNADAISV